MPDIRHLTNFKIAVEEDEVQKGCFKVTIRFETSRSNLFVPLRGVSKAEALKALAPIHYAFEFGLNASELLHQDIRTLVTRSPS